MGEIPVLKVEKLSAGYFGKEVLHEVSIEVKENEMVSSLIGPNGTGKSTFLKAVFGLLPLWNGYIEGKIFFQGENILGSSPRENIKRGISYLLQGGEIFPNLTVEDNLLISWRGDKKEGKERMDFIYSLFPPLLKHRKSRAGLLSGGERQMLAIGIAMMTKPKLLLADEPTAGLSYESAQSVLRAFEEMKKEGLHIFLVEQNIDEALKISDKVYLLRDGEVIAEGSPSEVSSQIEKLFYLE